MLDEDEVVPVLPETAKEEVVVEPEKSAEEAQMSIADMRRVIQEQQEQLAQLTEKLTEVTNTINK